MNRTFHESISQQLRRLLSAHRMVVFYDPPGDFTPFVDSIPRVDGSTGPQVLVKVDDLETHLHRFEGSFFALRAAIEPEFSREKPSPMLVYIPGVARDRMTSVLMEFEKAGHCYEPQMKRLARNALRHRYTDGDIDEMLAPESLNWNDVERLLTVDSGTTSSRLMLALGEGKSEDLLTRWLASVETDPVIEGKGAAAELFKLIQARLGFAQEEGTPLPRARSQTLRFVLVNEFRSDLSVASPPALSMVPVPADAKANPRIRDVARSLRELYPEIYETLAREIESQLCLADLPIDPSALGSIDTFPFEEVRLLGLATTLLEAREFTRALGIIEERGHSFWVDRELGRADQWEACRLMALWGAEIERVQPELASGGDDPSVWVDRYACPSGWYRVDRAQRALESWLTRMREELDETLERALVPLRRRHEELLETMAQGYSRALSKASWSIPAILPQTRIYPEIVEPMTTAGRVAYFWVDAMRFEMGADLADQLTGALDLRLIPAMASLPSITPVGMAALLPGASRSFSVVEHKGRLSARIGDSTLGDCKERLKYLKAVRPDARDIGLGDLLHQSTRTLEKKFKDLHLLIVRSQEIDQLGEMDGGRLARQAMDPVVSDLAQAVRKLSRLGFDHFVITADHGHQFADRKDDDMTLERPGGEGVEQHRRFWSGRGGITPGAALRVTGAELGYDTDLDFVFPKGLAVLWSGGSRVFHHGGTSLQEMVVPVLAFRMQPPAARTTSTVVTLEDCPEVLRNRTFSLRLRRKVDLVNREPILVRLLLLAGDQEVGRVGLAPDTDLDRTTATLTLPVEKPISVAMMLVREELEGKRVERVRVVALDPATGAPLAQSSDIEVKLGM